MNPILEQLAKIRVTGSVKGLEVCILVERVPLVVMSERWFEKRL